LASIFKLHRGTAAIRLNKDINPVIREWANYYKPFCSIKTFEANDTYLYQLQRRFALWAHPNKSFQWIRDTYFGPKPVPDHPKDNWVFRSPGNPDSYILKYRWVKIDRHILVPNGYNLDDPGVSVWWLFRRTQGVDSTHVGTSEQIAANQCHICPVCMQTLYSGEELQKHHVVPKYHNGPDKYNNLVLLHLMCHQKIKAKEINYLPIIKENVVSLRKTATELRATFRPNSGSR
jgi:RNA-directed DNA polymerase